MTLGGTPEGDPSSVAPSPTGVPDASEGPIAGHQIEQLALLTVAIVLAGIGFALHFVWFLSLLVLVLLWGYQAMSLRGSRSSGGLVSAIAGAAVTEARAIAVDVSAHVPSAGVDAAPASTAVEEPAAEGATRAELYEQAREADVPGRSAMTKSQLRDALAKED